MRRLNLCDDENRPVKQSLTPVALLLPIVLVALQLTSCVKMSGEASRGAYVVSVSPTSNLSCSAQREAKSWAVVVGINYYQDERIPDLNGAVEDAWNFYHYLVSPNGAKVNPSRVKLLLNDQATRAEVEDSLGSFLAKACPKDQVIIYFAGHGAPEPDRPSEAFLLVHDTTLDSMVSSAISMTQLPQFLKWRTGNTSKLFMLIDACHSGHIQFPGERGVKMRSIEDMNQLQRARNESINQSLKSLVESHKGWGVISASGANQLAGESSAACSLDGENYQGGIFTCALLDALGGEADQDRDRLLSFGELSAHISQKVTSIRGQRQTPQSSGDLSESAIIFPSISERLSLPRVPEIYLTESRTTPYRPWLYGLLTTTGVSLLGSLAMNVSANRRAEELNLYTSEIDTQLAGESGYRSRQSAYERDYTISRQLYVSTAIFGLLTGIVFGLDWGHDQRVKSNVYNEAPARVLRELKR